MSDDLIQELRQLSEVGAARRSYLKQKEEDKKELTAVRGFLAISVVEALDRPDHPSGYEFMLALERVRDISCNLHSIVSMKANLESMLRRLSSTLRTAQVALAREPRVKALKPVANQTRTIEEVLAPMVNYQRRLKGYLDSLDERKWALKDTFEHLDMQQKLVAMAEKLSPQFYDRMARKRERDGKARNKKR